ncbi:FHA domain-containing protein [Undibacterium amnicola]|uniref:FHA domain-containing protein n=1 Tax=Undibacterium amnicola TaxID=1834038 RepID=A0ABR6XT17_9BURK|nr:FHA domain-containing protein [Undibacterium amnicola]MBC3832592.1 FHA domain-containing protein [Undibacterium amnicola]
MNKSQEANSWQNLSAQASLGTLSSYGSGKLSAGLTTVQPYLRFSGYDPRAAGGRQTLKLELPEDFEPGLQQISLTCRSELIAQSGSVHQLLRSPAGIWPPILLSFSTKTREHGQYPLEIHLTYHDAAGEPHLWVCTSTILLPRANASLSEIHQVFLAAQKQYRVHAEDGAIAKLSGFQPAGIGMHANLDVDIYAKDAAIAQLDFNALDSAGGDQGKYAIGLSSIAWREVLIELAVPASSLNLPVTPARQDLMKPDSTNSATKSITNLVTNSTTNSVRNSTTYRASLVAKNRANAVPFHLLALDEWCLGRQDGSRQNADIQLQHLTESGQKQVLTKRISSRHAIIRRQDARVEITDVSRYGLLVDGVILEKYHPMPLFVGMRLELSASFKGLVELRVAAIFPHAVILQRIVGGNVVALFYLLNPEQRPEVGTSDSMPTLMPTLMPNKMATNENLLFFHQHGQFWYHDPHSLQDSVLDPSIELAGLHPSLQAYRYTCDT